MVDVKKGTGKKAVPPSGLDITLKHKIKHTKLQNAVELAQQRLNSATKQLTKKTTDHNEYLRDCAEGKLLEVQNELLALEAQIEVDGVTQEEKTQKDDEDSSEIALGLQEYFGVDVLQELINKHGEPVEPTRYGWALNDTFWGAASFLNREMLFSPFRADFYEYNPDNGLWADVSEDRLTSDLMSLIVTMNKDVFKKSSILKNVSEKFRHAAIQAQHGRPEVENKKAFLNKKRQHIQVANGVIVFEEGKAELKPFSPHYYSLHASPLRYDPTAECPKFKANMAHLHADDITLIQRAGGLFLIGYNEAERIFLFEGKGNSRKSTIVVSFKLVLGEGVITQLRTEHLNDRFELYRIYDKSLLIGSDVDEDFMLKEGTSVLKKLTGHDPLTGEAKGSNSPFDFDGELNVLVTSNSQLLLRLRTDADAWMRRIVLIPFPSLPNPPAQKPSYAKELFQEEGEGILRWMVDGANQVLKDFAEDRGFPLTAEQEQRVTNRIEESDAVNVFMKASVEQTGDPHEGITTEDFMFEYGKFCRLKDWKHSRISANQLREVMLHFGGEPSNHVHKPGRLFKVRGYLGVRWVFNNAHTGNGGSDNVNVVTMNQLVGKV